jgi:cold shock CspA family protein
MLTEPQITFRHMSSSPAVLADVQRRIIWLERFHPSIVGCHVAVEAPRKRHRQGGLFRVRVEVSVPGGEVVVSRSPPEHHSHTDVYVAIRDAFRAARRELMDRARLMRGDVKGHVAPLTGHIARLFDEPRGRYGFLETGDGREIYFHEHALLDEWEDVRVGDRVRFVEEGGDKGPQASTVERLGSPPSKAPTLDDGAPQPVPPAPGA